MIVVIGTALAGVAHFLIGGLWYSRWAFGETWMRGLGLTTIDISEGKVNVGMALAASATASFAQAALLAVLFVVLANPTPLVGALVGGALATGFGFAPMLRDRVWADRPWSVILVDAGYEIVGGATAGLIVAWWLGGGLDA